VPRLANSSKRKMTKCLIFDVRCLI
jgi:hypothetical protein